MAPNPNLQRLHQAGVSIWLDTLSRQLLDICEFAGLIHDCSLTGATSNPTAPFSRRPLHAQDQNAALARPSRGATNLMRTLVRQAGAVLDGVGRRSADLSSLISAGDQVFGATASRNAALTATVRALPPFLSELRASLSALDATGREATPVISAVSRRRR
jgi:ABC-type transporter Mla subunit MlaD